MADEAKRTRARARKPARNPVEKPVEPEVAEPTDAELMEQMIAIEVSERCAAIIDSASMDRMMLPRLCTVLENLSGLTCAEHPPSKNVLTAAEDAKLAVLERIERICNNDRPTYTCCRKCGE